MSVEFTVDVRYSCLREKASDFAQHDYNNLCI